MDKEKDKKTEGGPWWARVAKTPWEKLKAWVKVLRGDASQDVQRVAIWSVHPRVQVWYFWVFAAQTGGIVLPELFGRVRLSIQADGWWTVLTAYKEAWDAISGQLLSAAITTLIVTEIGGSLAMIASRMYEARESERNKRREEGREEERARFEAERASQAAASTEWLKRRDEAQRNGEPFDEEPPWEANGASES